MADRTLVEYEEPRLDDAPHWTVRIERSAAGQPGLFFITKFESVDGSLPEVEQCVVVEDGRAFLAPVLAWLDPQPVRLGERSDLDTPVVGAWTAMNDVEERDGYMHWAIFEYVLQPEQYARQLTQYDLSNAEAWAVVHSHNVGLGFE